MEDFETAKVEWFSKFLQVTKDMSWEYRHGLLLVQILGELKQLNQILTTPLIEVDPKPPVDLSAKGLKGTLQKKPLDKP